METLEELCDELQESFFSVDFEPLTNDRLSSLFNGVFNYGFDEKNGRKLIDNLRRMLDDYVDNKNLPAIEKVIRKSCASYPFVDVFIHAWDDYCGRIQQLNRLTTFLRKYDSTDIATYSREICNPKIRALLKEELKRACSEKNRFCFLSICAVNINGFFAEKEYFQLINSSMWSKLVVESSDNSDILDLIDSKKEAFKRTYREHCCELRSRLTHRQAYLFEFDALMGFDGLFGFGMPNNYDEKSLQIIQVDEFLQKESKKIDEVVDPEIRQSLMEIAEKELMIVEFSSIISENYAKQLLKNEYKTELKAILNLLQRYDKDKVYLSKMFDFIIEFFNDKNQDLMNNFRNIEGLSRKSLIPIAIDFIDKYGRFLKDQFRDKQFTELSEYVDRVLVPVFRNQPKTSELLVTFIDSKLRFESKFAATRDEEEDKRILSQANSLLKYIENKDEFLAYYNSFTSRRLLNQSSMSEDLEMFMFGEIQEQFGDIFYWETRKLGDMLRDCQSAGNYQSEFKDHIDKNKIQLSIPLNVRILKSIYWTEKPLESFRLPSNMDFAFEEFQKFYRVKHSNRKLTIWHDVGKVDLTGIFFKNGKKIEFIMTMSAYQAAILTLFNDCDCLTLEQIQQQTDIKKDDLVCFITPLKTENILILIGDETDISENSEFKLNKDFSSEHKRIQVPKGIKGENKVSRAEEKEIAAVRQNQMDAAIVRVMKASKSMTLAELTAGVITQLAGFKPVPALIRERVDALVRRNYLATSDNTLYEYVS